MGAVEITREYPNMSRAPRQPGPRRQSRQGETADEAAQNWFDVQTFEEEARATRVDLDDVLDRAQPPRVGGLMRVPMPQGVERDIDASGIPEFPGDKVKHNDPIDPITGELLVEHDDLSFPGFGVSFAHRRVYRSRTSYDGPLGHGWDFSYNQRLVAAPVDADDVEDVSDEGGSYCGPVLLLTTGNASTLRFRERARLDKTITYESDATDLELVGTFAGDKIDWVLTARSGDRRSFDSQGLLVGWTDANGIGLRFKWEAGNEVDHRLASVEDSVGRTIEYQYDGDDRLVKVSSPGSDLHASYEYDADGGLWRAVRGDGKSERYEYDVASGREHGDWIPERQAAGACRNACAMSTGSCDAGGACDGPVATATSACLDSCPDCAQQCNAACGSACQNDCGSGCEGDCQSWCSAPAQYNPMRSGCETLFDSSGADDACDACADVCRAQTDATCNFVITCLLVSSESDPGPGNNEELQEGCFRWTGAEDLGEDLLHGVELAARALFDTLRCIFSWLPGVECSYASTAEVIDEICSDDAADCCAFGDDCAPNSCTEGVDCKDSCRNTFLGYPVGGNCPAPITPSGEVLAPGYEDCRRLAQATPLPGTDLYDELLRCAGTASDWSLRNGCIPRELRLCNDECGRACEQPCVSECRGECGAICDDQCRVNDCATYCVGLDLPGQCEDSCTDACVEENHERGPFTGPKYGYTADLQFNLLRVYDGNGSLYLENTYGQDIASPDFDTVVAQRYGEHDVVQAYVDYAASGQSMAMWAIGMVDSLAEYDAPAICFYGCEAAPPQRNDLAVPWQDSILVFSGEHGEIPSGGWPVSGTLDSAVELPPSVINMTSDGAGTVAARSAKVESLFGTSFAVETPSGGVTLQIDKYGVVALLSKSDDALTALTLAGSVTLFGDGATLRAYPGTPYAVVAATNGRCSQPFHVARSASEEVTISPQDACDGDLWLAPVATRAQGIDALTFMEAGQGAIKGSQFRPSPLSPVRAATIFSRKDKESGVWQRSRAPSGAAIDEAAKQAFALYTSTPLFSAPMVSDLNEPPLDEPFYVFHQVKDGDPGYPPSSPPSDRAWIDQDTPDTVYNPPCDPTVPASPIWGTGETGAGAKPAFATAMVDMHGARWTYYADEHGRLIRTVNHENGASRWMEYDPDGRVTGVLEPDGARQCLKYDNHGSVSEILTLPAFHLDLVTPAPIRQRLAWTVSPARLAVVMDPRDPTRELRRMGYDAAGNLRSITEIDGLRTNIELVGGSSPARAMPSAIVGADGAVTRISYDDRNGTVASVVRDATGPSPVISELKSDEAGRPLWSTSPLGLNESFKWDGPLLHRHSWDGDGLERSEEYSYDDDVQLTTVTGPRAKTSLTYTAIGGIATSTLSALDGSVPDATRCVRSGPNGRILEEVSAEGLRRRYTRDAEGRVRSIVAGDLGPSPLAWDDACPPNASGESVVATIATFEYDVSGRLVAMVDGRGLRTTWAYDGFGRPIIERRPDGSEARTGYDLVGNVAWQAVYGSVVGPYRPPTWADAGLMSAVELRYDLRGRLEEELRWHFSAQGPIGDGYARTRYEYDDVARTVTVYDDLGRHVRSRSDGAGRPVETQLSNLQTVTTSYLDGGRTVRTVRAGVGGPIVEIASLTAAGALSESAIEVSGVRRVASTTEWIDPFKPGATTSITGAVTSPRYDAFDRVIGSISSLPDGVGEHVSLELDRDGRVRSRGSWAGPGQTTSTWTFGYDALGRLVREVDPAGAATDTDYVGATELVSSSVDARLVRTTMQWAPGGWLAHALVDQPVGDDVALSFVHDQLGRMLSASRRDGATTAITNSFAWDSLQNPTFEADSVLGISADRTHRYDGAGQRVSSTYGSMVVNRRFDLLGRQFELAVGNETPATATWTYGVAGGPLSRRLRNGVESGYGYDALSRLTSIAEWRGGSTRIAQYEWELPFDGVPRRLSSQQSNFPPENRVYPIDGAGRLLAEQQGSTATFELSATDLPMAASETAWGGTSSTATSYVLDGRNNWTSRRHTGLTTSYSRDARDALTAIGSQTVSNDATGAITNDGSATYKYDALGLLAEVRPTSGGGRLYKRDALGRVVSETDIASGAITRFAWDGAQRVITQRPNGGIETTLAAEGLDQPVVTIFPGGARRYFHQDRQGSVYAQTDDAGVGQLWISYSAYGEPSLRNASGQALVGSAVLSDFGYHGLPHDFGLGLVDMRARTYRPTLGRFLSPDPIGLLGDANLFAFVNSGPLTWRDPWGLSSRDNEAAAANRAAADHLRVLAVARGYEIGGLNFRTLTAGTAPGDVARLMPQVEEFAVGRGQTIMVSTLSGWARRELTGAVAFADGASLGLGPVFRHLAGYGDVIDQSSFEYYEGSFASMVTFAFVPSWAGKTPAPPPLPTFRGSRTTNYSTPAAYHVEDAADKHLYAIGEVKNGVLELDIQTRYIRGGSVVRGPLRGKEQFDAIVKHFDGQFTAIRGVWHSGDNLMHIQWGGTAETTWTGQQAARHGYSKATLEKYEFLPGTDDGFGGGDFSWAEFLFTKN